MYQRVYVKFLDTVNKREYVRLCSRKPRCKLTNSLRYTKAVNSLSSFKPESLRIWHFCFCHTGVFRWKPCWAWQLLLHQSPRTKSPDPSNPSPGQSPHQRRGRNGRRSLLPLNRLQKKVEKMMVRKPFSFNLSWHECSGTSSHSWSLISRSLSCTFLEIQPPVPSASRFLNTRTKKETFKSFVELLISIALDENVMTALERANGERLAARWAIGLKNVQTARCYCDMWTCCRWITAATYEKSGWDDHWQQETSTS